MKKIISGVGQWSGQKDVYEDLIKRKLIHPNLQQLLQHVKVYFLIHFYNIYFLMF